MPAEELTIIQKCGVCASELGTFTVKKDNMMLISKETIWCPVCNADRPEVRDLAGRSAAITEEQASYASNLPVSEAPRRGQD